MLHEHVQNDNFAKILTNQNCFTVQLEYTFFNNIMFSVYIHLLNLDYYWTVIFH